MKSRDDLEIRIVWAKDPDEFEEKVNGLLSQGGWRIANSEMSVPDAHYFALMIRAKVA